VDVAISMMNSGPVIANAVTGGSLDVGAMNSGSIAVARSRGIPLKFFAAAASGSPSLMTDVIMVRKDSPIHTGADFNNKTVGIVATKTMQYAAFLAWVDKHGGDSKTVKFIEIPFPEMVGSLDQRRVDAAIPVEPFTSAGRANNRILGSVYEAMPPHFLIFGFAATDKWLQTNPDVALKFATAIREAAAWANGHERDSAAMLVRFMKVDPALAAHMARATYATALEPSLLQPVVDVMVKYGILAKPIDPNELIWHPPSR
jgi:NitT/TauT family transport system substrate-binding protein